MIQPLIQFNNNNKKEYLSSYKCISSIGRDVYKHSIALCDRIIHNFFSNNKIYSLRFGYWVIVFFVLFIPLRFQNLKFTLAIKLNISERERVDALFWTVQMLNINFLFMMLSKHCLPTITIVYHTIVAMQYCTIVQNGYFWVLSQS